MKRPPVVLSPRQRVVAGQSLVESLRDLGVLLMAASVDGTHYHLLGRFPPDGVRSLVGRAKMHVAFVLRDHGIRGGVWAARCRALPVRSRSHQLNVFHYILDHARRGAWVWGFREGTPWRDV